MNTKLQENNKKSVLRTPEQVRQELALLGISVSDWARERNFSPNLVHQVLGGRLRCLRGQAHRVAVSLGLKEGELGEISDLPFR